jgi:hypothetical protein
VAIRLLFGFLALASVTGCSFETKPELDPVAARRTFHYHRSFQFDSPNREFRFELRQLGGAAYMKSQYGYLSTKEGRWDLLEEILSVEFNIASAMEELKLYLSEHDVQIPVREIHQLLEAIDKLSPCAMLTRMDNALILNDPAFIEKLSEFNRVWKDFNDGMRSFIRHQQKVPLQQEVMEFILRIYYSNYETFMGFPRRRVAPPPPPRHVFTD